MPAYSTSSMCDAMLHRISPFSELTSWSGFSANHSNDRKGYPDSASLFLRITKVLSIFVLGVFGSAISKFLRAPSLYFAEECLVILGSSFVCVHQQTRDIWLENVFLDDLISRPAIAIKCGNSSSQARPGGGRGGYWVAPDAIGLGISRFIQRRPSVPEQIVYLLSRLQRTSALPARSRECIGFGH